MCILLKSPVRSWTVTCAIRPRTFEGSSATVSPRSCLLNISGARRLYHAFAFPRSLIFRAETRGFFSAMRTARTRRVYIPLFGLDSVRILREQVESDDELPPYVDRHLAPGLFHPLVDEHLIPAGERAPVPARPPPLPLASGS